MLMIFVTINIRAVWFFKKFRGQKKSMKPPNEVWGTEWVHLLPFPCSNYREKKGNQFRRLRELSYFLLKKGDGSRNMKFYINIFPILFTVYGLKIGLLKLKLLRCVM
jgi:hypothetical protein